MGAACYKEKNITINKNAYMKIITDHYLHDTILTESPLNQAWLDKQKAAELHAQKVASKRYGYVAPKPATVKKSNKVAPIHPATMDSNNAQS